MRGGAGALVVFALAVTLASPARAGELTAPSRATIKMSVREVRMTTGGAAVLLQTDGGRRLLPIMIGSSEAHAIQLRLSNQQAVRPLTLDLLHTIIGVLGAKVERVEVDDLKENIFIGKVTLKDLRGKRYRVDGRPSDLIGLAAANGLPIWVAAQVLQRAGQAADKWASPSPTTP